MPALMDTVGINLPCRKQLKHTSKNVTHTFFLKNLTRAALDHRNKRPDFKGRLLNNSLIKVAKKWV